MSDFFVGFRPSPKLDRSLSKVSEKFEFEIPNLSEFLSLLTSEIGLSKWLAKPTKFDLRLGGKLKFSAEDETEFGGTYAQLDLPKRITILTEVHGEFEFSIRPKNAGGKVTLVCKGRVAEAELAGHLARIRSAVEKLMASVV